MIKRQKICMLTPATDTTPILIPARIFGIDSSCNTITAKILRSLFTDRSLIRSLKNAFVDNQSPYEKSHAKF